MSSSQQQQPVQQQQPPASSGGGEKSDKDKKAPSSTSMHNGFRAMPSASVVTTEPLSFEVTQGRKTMRPCVASTVNLVRTYKSVNERFFRRKRREAPAPRYNDGYDDREGHYIVIPGEEIMERYAVQEVLGKGSFGTVVKCLDSKRLETVAVKITRSGRTFRAQAKQEIDILLKLSRVPGLAESYITRLLKVFEWKGHLCLAFDLLSFNLFQLIQCTQFRGVSLDLTRKFAFQILMVLRALQDHDPPIIHCDIKPENVLLRSNNRSGIRVIDFGSSCFENRRLYRYIQSRFYRSPEVILGLDYTTAIDRWSLGTMLVELHTGLPLFDGRTEAQQLQRFVGLLGPLPYKMVAHSPKLSSFFYSTPSRDMPADLRNTEAGPPADVPHTTTGTDSSEGEGVRYWLKLPPYDRHVKNLRTVVGVETGGPEGRRAGHPGHEQEVYEVFVDFILGLLAFDPEKRIGVRAALDHPYLEPAVKLAAENTERLKREHEDGKRREDGAAAAAAPAASGADEGGSKPAAAGAGGDAK